MSLCAVRRRVWCALRRNMAVGLSFSYTHDRAILQQHIHSLETRAEQLGSELQQRAEAGAAGEAPLLQRQGEQELAECMKHGSALRAWRHQRASTAGLSGASELGAGRTQAAIEAGTAALTRMMSA